MRLMPFEPAAPRSVAGGLRHTRCHDQPFTRLQVLNFSKQRMADRANGIIEFSVNHDFEDRNVFHFWERYTSNATMGQHNTQPEITKFMENVSLSVLYTCILAHSMSLRVYDTAEQYSLDSLS